MLPPPLNNFPLPHPLSLFKKSKEASLAFWPCSFFERLRLFLFPLILFFNLFSTHTQDFPCYTKITLLLHAYTESFSSPPPPFSPFLLIKPSIFI